MSEDEPPEEVFVPQAPLPRKSDYARSVDQTYRTIEAQSEARAADAVSMLEDQYRAENRENPHEGNPDLLHDFQKNQIDELRSGLKITNMRDPSEMREGDTAVIQPSAEAARQRLAVAGGAGPSFQAMPGANVAPGVGPDRAGAGALSVMTGHKGWVDGTPASPNPNHQARAASMIRAGQMGAYSGKE